MDQLAIQTWVVIIFYFLLSVSLFVYGPKKERAMALLTYILVGGLAAWVTEMLARERYVMTSWFVALLPLILATLISIIASGTALGIMMVKHAPQTFGSY
jgi:hypothetical protein